MVVFIFGVLLLATGIILAIACFSNDEPESGAGGVTMALFGIIIIALFLFVPICELSSASVQTINGENFLVSVDVCHRNISPSKTWHNTYFTELAE
jgi:uncharacterized membrane protein HdeD (DUF308 family)